MSKDINDLIKRIDTLMEKDLPDDPETEELINSLDRTTKSLEELYKNNDESE